MQNLLEILNLLLVRNVILTDDGEFTVLCYGINIVMTVEMSAYTVRFLASAHTSSQFVCLTKFHVFLVQLILACLSGTSAN